VKNYAEGIIKVAGLSLPPFTASDRPGSVTQDNLMRIDWANLGSTFVLARTRRQLQDIADRLQLIGIPFIAERLRESPFNSSKGSAFYALARLRNKEPVNADDLRALAHHTRKPWLVHGAKAKIQKLVNAEFQMKEIEHFFTQSFLDVIKTENFIDILCYNIEDVDRSYLGKVYRTGGIKAFMKAPSVTLTTIHGSKGRQADTVVLLPDIGRKAYDGFIQDKQSEVFVAYVAVTRAINQVIMLPRETAEAFPYPRRS
jgi:ATP-dependent exoDNAse (exonuclease V) beta subunit